MREIKFRVFDKEKNKIRFDFVIETKSYEKDLNKSIKDYDGNILDNIEIMQFTGLKDKNGKEIYDGDVVRFADKYIYEIIFNKCKFSKKSKYGEFDLYDDEEDIEVYKHYDLEIIGNIYENPELIG